MGGHNIMTKYKHSYKGKFLDSKVDMIVDTSVERMLQRFGSKGEEVMKAKTREHDWLGRLTDSITWRTQKATGSMGSNAESTDLVSAPDRRDAVNIGTANPYAWYREHGAGPHQEIENGNFIPNLKKWFQAKIGQNPDDGAKGQFFFWNIVRKIQQGQDAVPFQAPSIVQLVRLFDKEIRWAGFERNLK
jgi:hypothetical protein